MKKILIANRGEIAIRIIRACRDAGYVSVAVASDADRLAMHARTADETQILPGTSPADTYLNHNAILAAATRAGADAIHPGYGFLSENDEFAAAVEAAGLIWIGPSSEAIRVLGDKVAARAIARSVGVPLLPSLETARLDTEMAQGFIDEHGLPVIIKAQNGGGGRGMRIVREISELSSQLDAAAREANLAFGRSQCFVERYLEHARHIETQCLADAHGNVAVLSTRDCTLQRRQQKLVEEAPAPFISKSLAEQLTLASTAILKQASYRGAATCEFLLAGNGELYFLEVNTRVQVEHPVTEEVTGIDIICEMFKIAEGEVVALDLAPISRHAIELRINAEDPWAGFRPVPGKIERLRLPGGPGVRLDFGYEEGDTLPPNYDSLVGKLIVTGRDRQQALARARRALAELQVEGIKTLAPLFEKILSSPAYSASAPADFTVHTRWVDEQIDSLAALAQATADRPTAKAIPLPAQDMSPAALAGTNTVAPVAESAPLYRDGIKAPLSGLILELCVSQGDKVEVGQLVAIMESMKMEQSIHAEVAGVVSAINVQIGSFIEMDADILGVD